MNGDIMYLSIIWRLYMNSFMKSLPRPCTIYIYIYYIYIYIYYLYVLFIYRGGFWENPSVHFNINRPAFFPECVAIATQLIVQSIHILNVLDDMSPNTYKKTILVFVPGIYIYICDLCV